jgi:lipopolysaccharide heptosyltransferase II
MKFFKKLKIFWRNMSGRIEGKRILFFLPNFIGDIFFTTPAIRAIRLNYPGAHLSALVWPGCAEVLEGNPDINEIILNREKERHRGFFGRWALIREIRKEKFDLVFLFHRSRTRAFLCALSGIPNRVGYSTKNRRAFLTMPLVPLNYDRVHRVEYYLGIVRGAGLEIAEPVRYVYEVHPNERTWAKEFLERSGIGPSDFKVILSPGGNRPSRRWSATNFGKLVKKMIETWGVKVILTGVNRHKEIFDEIKHEASYHLISAVGETNLKQLAGLIKEADLYIGNDSGPTHLAWALEKPILGFYAAQHPNHTGPYGDGPKVLLYKNKGCSVPCYSSECEWRKCIDEISVEEAFQAAGQLLKKSTVNR